jgi:hypothetical protein
MLDRPAIDLSCRASVATTCASVFAQPDAETVYEQQGCIATCRQAPHSDASALTRRSTGGSHGATIRSSCLIRVPPRDRSGWHLVGEALDGPARCERSSPSSMTRGFDRREKKSGFGHNVALAEPARGRRPLGLLQDSVDVIRTGHVVATMLLGPLLPSQGREALCTFG